MRIFRWLFVAIGLAVIIWAWTNSGFYQTTGMPKPALLLPTALGAGIIALGIGLSCSWWKFWFWTALALVGQAAALQLIDAGNKIHYQHYKLNDLNGSPLRVLALSVIVLQLACVGIVVFRRRNTLWLWLTRQFSRWQLGFISLVIFGSSVALSRSLASYATEIIFATLIQFINLANIILASSEIPADTVRRIDNWLRQNFTNRINLRPVRIAGFDRIDYIAALWVGVFTAVINISVYQMFPHIQDEIIYLFQAKYFALGKLWVDAPEIPEAFRIYMIPYLDAHWYSPFPPGWPAVLSIGVKSGLPWLVNPVLAALNTLLASIFFQQIFKPLHARMALLLLCTSPWFLYMGMNFMSHTLMLTLTLVAIIFLIIVLRTGRAALILISGVAVGGLSLVRPMDGLALAIIFFLILLIDRSIKNRLVVILLFTLTTMAIGSLILPYNRAITGDPFLLPLNTYYDRYFGMNTYALGFGANRGLNWAIDPLPGYQPVEVILNAALNIFSINVELFGWATGSLILVSIGIIAGHWTLLDRWMVISVLVLLGLYSLFWFSGGPDFGARYWYLTLIPLIYFSVRGIQQLEQKFDSDDRTRVLLAVFILCIFSVLNYLPWRAFDKYYHYLDMKPDLAQLSQLYNFENGLILIQGQSHPDYAGAWVWNPIEQSSSAPVFAHFINTDIRDQLLTAYSDRMIWIIQGPTVTDDTYQVVAGPLTSDQARRYLP